MAENWTNSDNATFYEHNTDILQEWADAGGLASWPDLIAIHAYIDNAERILEIGAGYGRVQHYLLEHFPNKSLSALEKSSELFNTLKQQFAQRISLIHADITTYTSKQCYDLILWMWSGITDFSQAEQPQLLKHIQPLLSDNGRLIIETFPHDLTPVNGSTVDTQSYLLTANEFTLHGYIPSPEEMRHFAEQAGLTLEKQLTYTTDSGRERKLYVLAR